MKHLRELLCSILTVIFGGLGLYHTFTGNLILGMGGLFVAALNFGEVLPLIQEKLHKNTDADGEKKQ